MAVLSCNPNARPPGRGSALAWVLVAAGLCAAAAEVRGASIGPRELAVVVNLRDPESVRVGRYYQRRRGLPAANFVPVSFDPEVDVLSPEVFATVKARLDEATPRPVQAYLLAWDSAYRVGCMSMTTAVAAGFDPAFCARGCAPTRESPLFRDRGHRPFDAFGWRPAMMLPAADYDQAREWIERGIAADGTFPLGTAYLVSTGDRARNVRAAGYARIRELFRDLLEVVIVRAEALSERQDVLFYFTGRAWVADIASNRFLPGAVADHLTSAGGRLRGGAQMPATAWLEAGATGTYGAVVEPCNFLEKFPDPETVMDRYLEADPLIEAYWKSVRWPGQGLFLGEPLARPFGAGSGP